MQTVKLKDVVMRVKDKIDKDNTQLEYYIGGEHIDSGELCITKKGKLEGSTIGPAFHMHFMPGDVLLMSRNPHLKKAGVVDFEGICSDVSYICRTKDENILSQRYLPFVFQTDHFWKFVEENKKGGLPFFLNWSDFEKYEFQLPDIDKQREMADLLWAAQETKLAYIELLKQTDELVKSQFIEMFGSSKNYETKFISDISEVIAGGDKPQDNSEIMTEEYCYPVYANGIENEGLQCYAKNFRVNQPAITISARGTIGATFIRKPCFTPIVRLIAIIPNREVNVTYLKYAIDAKGVSSTGSSQQQLTIPNIKKEKIQVPPLEMQQKFEMIAEQSDKSKFEIKKSIENINVLMKSLMQENYNN